MKLEYLASVILQTNFRNGFSAFRRNNSLLMKLECQSFRETTVLTEQRAVFVLGQMRDLGHALMNQSPCRTCVALPGSWCQG